MTGPFSIETIWEALDQGSLEEISTFSELIWRVNGFAWTHCRHVQSGKNRDGTGVAAVALAEWLAWNWWRLFHEPPPQHSDLIDWNLAHRLSSVGQGYVWPDITLWSDGVRSVMRIRAMEPSPHLRWHYDQPSRTAILPSAVVESALDDFFVTVLDRLHSQGIKDSNFETLLSELRAERTDPALSRVRRLEAAMGQDPGVIDDQELDDLIAAGDKLGFHGLEELAADQQRTILPTVAHLQTDIAARGETFRLAERLAELTPPAQTNAMPWRVGQELATQIRRKEGLETGPISNHVLSDWLGLSEKVILKQPSGHLNLCLGDSGSGHLTLKSGFESNRRFALARFIADLMVFYPDEQLHPATDSFTYRQKIQRAFATELLCPIRDLTEYLGTDLSEDARMQAAEHFNVSERTILTTLMNHKKLPRHTLLDDLEDGQLVA